MGSGNERIESLATAVTPGAPSQRADARRNRKRILEAARELFAEHGFDAQMDQIASRAGVGVGTVYRHFPNKCDLLEALIEERFEGLAAAAREGIANPDPWNGFEGFMRYSAGVMAGDRALSEAMFERPETMRAGAEGVGMPDLLGELVGRAQAEGGLRDDMRWDDVPGLICGIGRALVDGKVGPLEMSWERYLQVILDGLRAPGSRALPD
jgi:AcrR family transcriptional regulator